MDDASRPSSKDQGSVILGPVRRRIWMMRGNRPRTRGPILSVEISSIGNSSAEGFDSSQCSQGGKPSRVDALHWRIIVVGRDWLDPTPGGKGGGGERQNRRRRDPRSFSGGGPGPPPPLLKPKTSRKAETGQRRGPSTSTGSLAPGWLNNTVAWTCSAMRRAHPQTC